MKAKQDKEELFRLPEKELLAKIADFQKDIVSKTIAAHKNELKNIRELRRLKKLNAQAKTILWQKRLIQEKT